MSASASSGKGGNASVPSGSAPAPPKATNYRSPVVEDDDEDDLDDLDDVLDSFNAPAKPALGKRPQPDAGPSSSSTSSAKAAGSPLPPASSGAAAASAPGGDIDDDEFQASLIEGMESLLRSLAAEHPPGPMPDAKGTGAAAAGGGKAPAPPSGLNSEEEEKAFQRAVEMMLSGEGLDALGMDGSKKSAPAAAAGAGPSATGSTSKSRGAPGASFDDTIRKTMESLNQGGAGAAAGADGMPGDLAALLKQLSEDPSALDGLGDDDDELGGLLDGMMAQLMSKDVLEEPMTELAAKYPGYLEKPPAGVKEADLAKYRQQHELVLQILAVFKRPNYTDEVDGKEVARLVGEMQDLGGPPNEIMGELPEGFDLGALGGGEDGCVIM